MIIASSSTYYVDDPEVHVMARHGGHGLTSKADRGRAWQEGLDRLLNRLDSAGVTTVVVHAIPRFTSWQPATCPAFRLWADQASCGQVRSRAVLEGNRAASSQAERQAVAGHPRSRSLDLFPLLCQATTCATERNGTWTSRDASHITVHTSHALAGTFAEVLRTTPDP